LIVTDVLAAHSYLLFSGDEEKIKKIFSKRIGHLPGFENAGYMFLRKVVSRKKQVQPKALMFLEK